MLENDLVKRKNNSILHGAIKSVKKVQKARPASSFLFYFVASLIKQEENQMASFFLLAGDGEFRFLNPFSLWI